MLNDFWTGNVLIDLRTNQLLQLSKNDVTCIKSCEYIILFKYKYCPTLNVVSIKTLTLKNKYHLVCYLNRNVNHTKCKNVLSIGKFKLFNLILSQCKLLLCFYGFLQKTLNYYNTRYHKFYKKCIIESHHRYNSTQINKLINKTQKYSQNFSQMIKGKPKNYRNE